MGGFTRLEFTRLEPEKEPEPDDEEIEDLLGSCVGCAAGAAGEITFDDTEDELPDATLDGEEVDDGTCCAVEFVGAPDDRCAVIAEWFEVV